MKWKNSNWGLGLGQGARLRRGNGYGKGCSMGYGLGRNYSEDCYFLDPEVDPEVAIPHLERRKACLEGEIDVTNNKINALKIKFEKK